MLLVVDVGNTNTRVGVWENGSVVRLWISPTVEVTGSAAVGAMAERVSGPETGEASVALCSVVAEAEAAWQEWSAAEGRELFLVRGDTRTPLRNRYREPARLGGDRLAAAVGAVKRVGAPVIAVSLGTATVVDAVSARGEFLGGAVAVGVQTGLDALAERTGGLPRVEVRDARGPLGGDTEACLLSGATYGTGGLVEGLVGRMRERVGADAPVVLTGGHADLVSGCLYIEHEVVPTLTLEGVGAVWEHNRGKGA
jgi:type III pantothenate kinase